jgi:putative addiction module component (TIGR02574 family)
MLLPVDDRIVLAHRLLASAANEKGEDLDALWDAEARARMDRYDRGETDAIDGEKFFKEIDKKLGR